VTGTGSRLIATRQEIARVLTEEFKEGDILTKYDVRDRCTHGQMDMQWPRRFRELPDHGWVIDGRAGRPPEATERAPVVFH
jgi:hypothetical protein